VPAMISGSELIEFQTLHPEQIIDVGICESFAVCFSGSLALNGKTVFVPIYSSFLQRAYDQMSHDICRQNLHVVFGIDRAGLVGDDGDTHQGIYDIAYLRHLPNITIVQPKDAVEAYQLLDLAFKKIKGPVAMRYSNQSLEFGYLERYAFPEIPFGTWSQLKDQGKINLITYGDNVRRMQSLIEKSQLPINLFNARFIKPMDETLLKAIATNRLKTFVLEDVSVVSGLGSAILEFLHTQKIDSSQIEIIGLPDAYIDQGKVTELYQKFGMDDESLLLRFTDALK